MPLALLRTALCAACCLSLGTAAPFVTADIAKVRSVTEVRFSPDGKRIAYTVDNNDGPGKPYSQVWILTLADGQSVRLTSGQETSSSPVWSPDGRQIAWTGKSGLMVSAADGKGARAIARVEGTNS